MSHFRVVIFLRWTTAKLSQVLLIKAFVFVVIRFILIVIAARVTSNILMIDILLVFRRNSAALCPLFQV